MARTSQRDLDEFAATLTKVIGGEPYYINWAYGRPALYRKSGHGAEDVSPRLRSGELWEWMRAYLRGYEQCRRRR